MLASRFPVMGSSRFASREQRCARLYAVDEATMSQRTGRVLPRFPWDASNDFAVWGISRSGQSAPDAQMVLMDASTAGRWHVEPADETEIRLATVMTGGVSLTCSAIEPRKLLNEPWLTTTPFGVPVEPEV